MGCGYAQLTCLVPSHFQVYHSIVPSSSSSSSTPHKTRKGTKRKKANNCSQFLENWPHSSCRPLFPPSLFFLLNSSIFLSTKDMKTCSWSFVAILMMRSEKKIKNVEEILEFATTLESNFIFLNHNILSKKCWKYTLKFIKNIWGGGEFWIQIYTSNNACLLFSWKMQLWPSNNNNNNQTKVFSTWLVIVFLDLDICPGPGPGINNLPAGYWFFFLKINW